MNQHKTSINMAEKQVKNGDASIATLLQETGSSIFSPPTDPLPKSAQLDPNQSEAVQLSVGQAIVELLQRSGVRCAFGVSGGGIGPLWSMLEHSSLQVLHCRHETGAAFAAIEAYFASGRPTVVFTTTGPGITNALTGCLAARGEGAKVILLSASTATGNRGRGACQETSSYTMPVSDVFTPGSLFHYAATIESGDELPEIAHRLAHGLARPGGFVAHLSVPTPIQMTPLKKPLPQMAFSLSLPTASEAAISKSAQLLSSGPFAIWVGFGARGAAAEIRELAEKTGAAVMCSPRGKGIFPEDHPQFVGVTGFSGHESVLTYMQDHRPAHILVLGTRLGEPTSFWSPVMIPSRGFVHVDLDPEVPGAAYPNTETFSIQSEIGAFVKALLHYFPHQTTMTRSLPHPDCSEMKLWDGQVRPRVLMEAIQQIVVEESDAIVMAEAGNSFAWATHHLRFAHPDRYRISTGVGAMGHAVTGVVGAALGRTGKAVAIVGDGAMLMNNEISTAVRFQIPAVWIVLNDGRYNMCAQGMALQGFQGVDTKIPTVDFVMLSRSMGADGIRVERESDLPAVLEKALRSPVPFVVDVMIDPSQPAPIGGRVKSLISQGATESKTETKGDVS